jgi:hypothetical protein
MRLILLACALLCFGLCGCGLLEDESRQVESTGRGVNLMPTNKERRAGAD